jgi:hypothetical protein
MRSVNQIWGHVRGVTVDKINVTAGAKVRAVLCPQCLHAQGGHAMAACGSRCVKRRRAQCYSAQLADAAQSYLCPESISPPPCPRPSPDVWQLRSRPRVLAPRVWKRCCERAAHSRVVHACTAVCDVRVQTARTMEKRDAEIARVAFMWPLQLCQHGPTRMTLRIMLHRVCSTHNTRQAGAPALEGGVR